jgi:hypothetical protein
MSRQSSEFFNEIGAKPPNLACGPAADIIRMSSLRHCMFRALT